MPYNTNKCQILQVGSCYIKNDFEICGAKVESVHSVKDLGVTVAPRLNFSKQCNASVKKADRIMGLINSFFLI